MLAAAPLVEGEMADWFGKAFASAVVLVWTLLALDGVVDGDWQGFQVATPVMLLVASFVGGLRVIRERKNGNGNGEKKP